MKVMKMKYRRLFLVLGMLLSAISKSIQFTEGSLIGDLFILPAGTCFVLAILFFIPQFQEAFQNCETKNKAIRFAFSASLAVLCFQLFTMLTFGYNQTIGVLFLPLFLVFAGWTLFFMKKIGETIKK
ncbi:MAG TPA: hypothetical protein VK048_07455 [Atopostipes sp.]|nr:hypothetical protein [Atopostipes sp.]